MPNTVSCVVPSGFLHYNNHTKGEDIMAQKITKQPSNDGKWKVLSQKTQAKVSRSYMQNGEARTEQEELFGNPAQCQMNSAPKHSGEATHLEWVHTFTDMEREYHENTTNGITKRREVRTVQTYDFGNGNAVKTSANPDGVIYKNSEDEQDMNEALGKDKTDYLKNMHDQLDNAVQKDRATNASDHRVMWVMIAIAFGLAIAGLVLLAV